MADIQGFTTDDCRSFYDTFYSPNNATIVVVGDVTERRLLELVQRDYGAIPPAQIPLEDSVPEPPQTEERRVETTKPTTTEKLVLGYHAPALGDFDHPALSLLCEVLFGGRASRVYRRLVRQMEVAVDVHAFVGPFHDPGLFEIFASARDQHAASELLTAVDEELERVRTSAIGEEELERAKARMELSLVSGLETVDGKAQTIGFYDTVIGRPAAAFERLEASSALTASDLLRVARRYLRKEARSVILVHRQPETKGAAA
jgi:zinc protease